MTIELATAYVSVLPDTSRLEAGIRDAVNNAGRNLRVTPRIDTRSMTPDVSRIGSNIGTVLGTAVGISIGSTISSGKWLDTKAFHAVGASIGNVIKGGILGVLATVGAAASYTIFKGFERIKSLDTARRQLEVLNETWRRTGKGGLDVIAIMEDVKSVVEGTPVALNAAFAAVPNLLAANIKPGKELHDTLTAMVDAVAAMGGTPEALASISDGFKQVANHGKLMTEDLQNQFSGIPLRQWLIEALRIPPEAFDDMVSDGRIGMEHVVAAIEYGAQGMGKAAAGSIEGAIEQVKTAAERLGASIINAIFGGGDATDASKNIVNALDTVKAKLDDFNKWVSGHVPEITNFFKGMASGLLSGVSKVIGVFAKLYEIEAKWQDLQARTTLPSQAREDSYARAREARETAAALREAQNDVGGFLGGLAGTASPPKTYPPGFIGPIPVGAIRGNAPPQTGPTPPPPLDFSNLPGTGGTKKPSAPQTPYPAEYTTQPLPGESMEQWQDRLSRIKAANRVQEEQARLDQLIALNNDADKENNVDESEIINARNALIDAQIAQTENEARLNEAKKKTVQVSMPPGYGQPPRAGETAEQYAAEQSYYEVVHKRQQAEAELAELQADSTATDNDLIEAQNELAKARSDEYQAIQRLNKGTDKFISQFGEMAVQMDPDFGASRGLLGLAENLVKLVMNLAAAPILGQLRAQTAVNLSKAYPGATNIPGMTTPASAGPNRQPTPLVPQAAPTGQPLTYTAPSSTSGTPVFVTNWPIQFGGTGQPGQGQQPSGDLTPASQTRQPYGLPGNTRIGQGEPGFPNWVNEAAARFNLKPATYPGHQTTGAQGTIASGQVIPNPQGLNRGIDWYGTPENLSAFAKYLRDNGLAEQVIYKNPDTGEEFGYPLNADYSSDYLYHSGGPGGHLHTRFSQSVPLPQANTVMNTSGAANRPDISTQQGMMAAIVARGRQLGLTDTEIRFALAVGKHESNWSPVGFMGFGPEAKAAGLNFDANPQGAIDQYFQQYTSRKPAGLDPNNPDAIANYIWRTVHNAADPNYGSKLLNAFRSIPSFASGGAVPIIAHTGEHVLTSADVDAMGGQSAVYAFRRSLHFQEGGGIPDWLLQLVQGQTPPKEAPPELVPPDTTQHGQAQGAPPGPESQQVPEDVLTALEESGRTPGFTPVGGELKTVPGTSMISKALQIGNEFVGFIIDTGAEVAQSAISAAITAGIGAGASAGGPGAGAAAALGPAASQAAGFGIKIAANELKNLTSYGFQMAGILTDSVIEQLFSPFGGPPRWIGYDYSQFVPSFTPAIQFGVTSLEKAVQAGIAGGQTRPGQQPGGPVQPETMPGAQVGQGTQPPLGQRPSLPPEPVQAGPVGTGPLPGPAPAEPAPAPAPAPPPPEPPPIPPPLEDPASFIQNLFGFDQGGLLAPGQLGVNLTKTPEPVLTPDQWDVMANQHPARAGSYGTYIENLTVSDVNELKRELDKRDRLAMMRHAARP